ncbi:MAG: extracellular solute-binding protein [Tepidisphaeraceae bacterium]
MSLSRSQLRYGGYLPLRMALVLAGLAVVALGIWMAHSTTQEIANGRQTIVFWGVARDLGDDIYPIINQFEHIPENLDPRTGKPKYRVLFETATSPDLTSDAQRLMCAISGKVPPDVVWFDRFAIGEWASRGALEDLLPYIKAQRNDERYRVNLEEFYRWSIDETSYRPPGSGGQAGIFGVPMIVDMRLLYCNVDLLLQEGLVDPQTHQARPPRTWEELRHYANALTRYNRPGNKSSGIRRLGFAPNSGNSWLYLFAWQAGGELMNADRTKVTLDSPPVIRALRYMAEVYDDLGGLSQVDAFQQSFIAGELDPFLQGRMAMKIDGTGNLEVIADWKPNMDFLACPAPIPADRLAAGAQPVTWGGGYSLVMPSTAQNKEGGWKLIQYLTSKPVMLQLEEGRREQKQSEGKLYVPHPLANRVINEELIARYVDGNPNMPPSFKQAYAVVKAMMPHTLHRPVTPVGQLLWNEHVHAYEAGVLHTFRAAAREEMAKRMPIDQITESDVANEEMHLALANAQSTVQRRLDEAMAPLLTETRVNWTPWFWAYGIGVASLLASIPLVYRWRKREHSFRGGEVAAAMLFASPWMLGFIIFVGGPIFFSLLIAATRYSVLTPAHWVGWDNFRLIFQDKLFYKSLGNTAFMILRIPLTMAASLAMAMLLNYAIRGMSFYRTACYMPAIVPVVASSLLWMWIFNPSQGIINQVLLGLLHTAPLEWFQKALGHHLAPPLWLQDQNWSKPSLILMSLWSAGAGIIIWLAGLQSIPGQLYEAAAIDGASAWRRFWNVTVPMLSPYILFNFIVGVIGTMQIFNEAFVMTQGGPADSTLFYSYYLFRQAFQYFQMGYASALAWVLFVIVLGLTLLQLWISRKWVYYEGS